MVYRGRYGKGAAIAAWLGTIIALAALIALVMYALPLIAAT
jgi:hypothetical protein